MRFVLLSAVILTSTASLTVAQQSGERPSREAMRAAIQEMGVEPKDMRGCMKEMRASMSAKTSGEKPTAEQRSEGQAMMFECLNGKNPDLTRAQFDASMQKLRPAQG